MSKSPRRKLKIGTIDDFHHFWYLLIWIVYLSLFYLAEHLVTENYWVSYLPIDDQIPFCRFFIVPYCMWHPLLVLMTAYLIFTDPPAFKRFMLYIGFGVICGFASDFQQNDCFIWLVKRIYAADTNTNVIPSMHVIGCAALALACFDAPRLRAKKLHLVMLPLGLLISMSTVFVKQHSMLDVLVAIPVSALLCVLIYKPFPRNRLQQSA